MTVHVHASEIHVQAPYWNDEVLVLANLFWKERGSGSPPEECRLPFGRPCTRRAIAVARRIAARGRPCVGCPPQCRFRNWKHRKHEI